MAVSSNSTALPSGKNLSRRSVLASLVAAPALVVADSAGASTIAVALAGSAGKGDDRPSIDERLNRLPPEIASQLRARFHSMIDDAMLSQAPEARLAPLEQAQWHIAEAHRLLQQATGSHWDCAVGWKSRYGFAMLIERDRPADLPHGGWRRAVSEDGSSETVFNTYQVLSAPD